MLGGLVGWKVGATSSEMQERNSISEPFRGPLFGAGMMASPAFVHLSEEVPLSLLEAEVGFVFGSDVPADCTAETAWACIEEVVLCIEVCGSRLPASATPFQRFADCAGNVGVVTGPRFPAGPLRGGSLAGLKASITVNGVEAVAGTGANVLGDPIQSIVWLAHQLAGEHHIMAGQTVISGACAFLPPTGYSAGDEIVARFEGPNALGGEVKLRLPRTSAAAGATAQGGTRTFGRGLRVIQSYRQSDGGGQVRPRHAT